MRHARSALHMTFCVQFNVVMTSVSCAMSLRGTACFGVFGPAPEIFRRGLRTSVEIALAPAREGYGGCAGANDGPTDQRISVSREGTKQPCRPIVSRLLDALARTRLARTEAACPPCNMRQLKVAYSDGSPCPTFAATRSGCHSHSARHGHAP